MRHYWPEVGGWFDYKRGVDVILDALPKDRPSIFVEVGTWLGKATAYLGVEIVNRELPARLVAIDHFKGSAEMQALQYLALAPMSEAIFRANLAPVSAELGDRFTVMVGDSAASAASFDDESLDAVWIDAAHDYESVKADVDAWWPKVKLDGWIGGDDWTKCPGVRQAVSEQLTPHAGISGTVYWLVRRGQDGARPL
jgi:predicted O-methyltransferase YrrM